MDRTIALLRETRRALVQSEKLAALGELSTGMAHEINNLDLAATRPIRVARQDLQQVLVNLVVNAIHAQEQGATRLDSTDGQHTLGPIRVSTAD